MCSCAAERPRACSACLHGHIAMFVYGWLSDQCPRDAPPYSHSAHKAALAFGSENPQEYPHRLLSQGGRGDLVNKAVVVRLGIGPVVLGQILDVLDVLGADRAVVERVVVQAAVDPGVVGEGCPKHASVRLTKDQVAERPPPPRSPCSHYIAHNQPRQRTPRWAPLPLPARLADSRRGAARESHTSARTEAVAASDCTRLHAQPVASPRHRAPPPAGATRRSRHAAIPQPPAQLPAAGCACAPERAATPSGPCRHSAAHVMPHAMRCITSATAARCPPPCPQPPPPPPPPPLRDAHGARALRHSRARAAPECGLRPRHTRARRGAFTCYAHSPPVCAPAYRAWRSGRGTW